MARTNHPDPPLAVTAKELPNGVLVLHVHDAIDAMNSAALDTYLKTQVAPRIRCVIVDLTETTTVSAAGVRVLVEHSNLATGPRLLTVPGASHIERLLELTAAKGSLDIYDSVADAITASTNGLRQEVFDLRAALRTRPLIARALGVLQGRYDLGVDASFTLMRECAQRHNLKLSTLASAVLAAKPPAGKEWFPGRIRRGTPTVSYLADKQNNRTAVLGAFLDSVLETMDTDIGDLQLLDPLGGVLQMEQHRGLSAEFIDFFATVSDSDTSCGTALRRRERVIVTDVAKDPIFAGTESGEMVLAAGVQSVQSTPVLRQDGRCVAMVSTHHSQLGLTPSAAQAARLDKLALETALWLDWHQRTVVLDALEYLHQEAQRLR